MLKDKFRIYIFNKLPLSVETMNLGGGNTIAVHFMDLWPEKAIVLIDSEARVCVYEAYVVSIIYCHFIETIKRDQILNDIFCVTCRPHNQTK